MKREDYLRDLEASGREMRAAARDLAEAANPVNQLRSEVARDWKWWLPGASMAGFAVARLLRSPRKHGPKKERPSPAAGAAFWVPVVLKILPGLVGQLVPLFLSLRSGRKN